MPSKRASGILAHPTSIPGPHGIGDLGPDAYRFVDFLAASKQRLWQVLPLGPVGYGDSPYAARSAFAGNHLFVSLEELVLDGLLRRDELESVPVVPIGTVNHAAVNATKTPWLRLAFERLDDAPPDLLADLEDFRDREEVWLRDYALFASLQAAHHGLPWQQWESALTRREPAALERAEREFGDEVAFQEFVQFVFHRQWLALRAYAATRGIRIIGDMPIFVANDSADVWAHTELFRLDADGRPTVVAGVPPDYFSKTGQLWGNPIYDWRAMARTDYAWWVDRTRRSLELVDYIRLDHFRGFQAFWEVPAGEETAVRGRWVEGPGLKLFAALNEQLGELPFIAEDLGVITRKVVALREKLELPGMKVLQFAFDGDPLNLYLPHNYDSNCVVYTGTHDNDTTRGWFASAGPETQHRARVYMARDGHDIAWDLVRLASASVADWAIFPLQDVLDLGSDARMNTPGRLGGNWGWRYDGRMLSGYVSDRLGQLTELYGRGVPPKPRKEATTDEEAESAADESEVEATGEAKSAA
jgi:4-alpha-glucanotransferase